MKPSDILYENGPFYVCREGKGFAVYKNGFTCSSRVAIIGFPGQVGLDRAKLEANKRADVLKTDHSENQQ
jgi:hypothetical protein